MPELPKKIGVAADLAGCPNRCRHCYLGNGPNGRLDRDVLRQAADALWKWSRPGATEPYFHQVDVASWYREPDFSDDYRGFYEIERELSRRAPRRYELLSVWRLARDEGYAAWAKERGPRICQITFFGMEELTDRLTGRQGAFRDARAATQRLLGVGMVPRWQVILTRPGLPDLSSLLRTAKELDLTNRVADLGERFDMFCHPPGPDGEAWQLEDVRIEEADLAAIPGELMESTRRHFGGKIEWQPEARLVHEVLAGRRIPPTIPSETWFFVNAELDVFSNYGDLTPPWRLGNMQRDGWDNILRSFEEERPPALWTTLQAADAELARRFGRKESLHLYSPGDAKSRWVRLACGAMSS
jgi:hypothetical protein